MDGLKKRLSESVQFRLSFALCLVILVAAIVAGAFSFLSAFDEARELQDDVLRQVARLVERQRVSPVPLDATARGEDSDAESRVIVQRLGDAGPGTLQIAPTLADGLHSLEIGRATFRVLIRTGTAGERIAVSQPADLRNEIARDSALRTVMPFLILMPVLLLLVADLVRKMFRPITALATEIDQRAEQDLQAVQTSNLPTEVRPFAVAINRLLARVVNAMEAQRRFVADAAHELRSPLTALSLQAQRLADADMPGQARERLAALRQGIERGRSLLDQLLSMAKAQSPGDCPGAPVSVQGIYRRVLEDLMPMAEAKRLDIGVEGAQDAHVWVSELDMTTIVKNLVDNAIRYTAEGGRVDLSIAQESGRVALRVRDTGPGIPLAERDRVFDPFYRALGSAQIGSGLGLSIVQTIAKRIGAEIHLGYCDEATQAGLSVTIILADVRTARAAEPRSA